MQGLFWISSCKYMYIFLAITIQHKLFKNNSPLKPLSQFQLKMSWIILRVYTCQSSTIMQFKLLSRSLGGGGSKADLQTQWSHIFPAKLKFNPWTVVQIPFYRKLMLWVLLKHNAFWLIWNHWANIIQTRPEWSWSCLLLKSYPKLLTSVKIGYHYKNRNFFKWTKLIHFQLKWAEIKTVALC